MYEPKVKNDQTELLMEAVLALETKDDAYRFFEDICTIAEVRSIAQRMQVARLLRQKVTYQEIARITGASTATISRVNRALTYGADGYHHVLDALDAKEAQKDRG
ncbi:MAG: YerC/YecD family TrpR-related protein [bacterium]|nr:YerC/YecD family TrpR-related protein [bacterium]